MTKFVNPEKIIAQLDLPKGSTVADFGCGSGFYALALAEAVSDSGKVYAIDILQDKLAATESSARLNGYKNIVFLQADLEKPLEGIAPGECDLVVMSNVVHQVKELSVLIGNAYSILKTGGKLLIVEWNGELTPFGPASSLRVDRHDLINVLEKQGMRFEKDLNADGYHYAILFVK